MNGGWPEFVRGVQPGGGFAVRVMAWVGRWRRGWLRRFRPRYVAAMAALRDGACPGCPHDVVDGRDVVWVQNVCGIRFPPPHRVSPFRDRFGLVRLGRPELLLATCVGAVVIATALATVPMLALSGALPPLFAAWFFRDPERCAPASSQALLAPADGVLDDVRREASCPFFAGPAWRLGIYLSVFDVHVQRAPIAGRVVAGDYRRGRCVPTKRRGHTDANEQANTTFVDDHGTPVTVRQLAGPFASRIVTVVRVGDVVRAGDRFGLIKFGSRCELFVPVDRVAELRVVVGTRVRAGESVLAEFVRQP